MTTSPLGRDSRNRSWYATEYGDNTWITIHARCAQRVSGKFMIAVFRDMQAPSPPIAAKINDIVVEEENLGIGSLLLNRAIAWCKMNGIERIFGELSSVDADHFDKLQYFYEKHGFTVRWFNHEKAGSHTAGYVEKYL